MRFVEKAPLRVRILFISLIAAVVLGAVLMLVGFSPAVEVAAVLAVITLAFTQRFGWATSLAAAILLLLLGNTLLLRVLPLVGIDLGVANGVALAATGLGLLAWLYRRLPDIRLPTRAALTTGAAALLVPVLTGLVAAATLGIGERMRVGWMMGTGTDTVWNTVASRFILDDNGIAPWLNPNPSPLVNGLMASWYAPGRGAAEELLRHDVSRQSELLILLFLLCGVLAGIVVARVIPARRLVLRVLAGIFGSAIPLTWYMTGFVIRFGFFNVPIAIAVLFCVWLLWSDLQRHVAASIGLLLVATTILLAAWAPLAALSLGLAGVAVLVRWRALLRLRGWHAVVFGLAALQLVLYILLVTLPDLTRDGAALGANGGVPEITPLDVVLVAVLIFAFAAVASVGLGQRHELLGVVVILIAAVIGIAYLTLQRRGMDTLWGYYPAKLGWLVSVLLVVLLAASALRWLGHADARGVNIVAVLVATVALVGLVIAKVPPIQRDLAGLYPLVGIGLTPESSADAAREDALFAEAETGTKTIFAEYSATAGDDAFINFWAMQLGSVTSDDPIRKYAYVLDPTNPADICAAIEAWDGNVVVITGSTELEAELKDVCPQATFDVEVR
ncbi:hypothetical protein [Leifsonia sp. A12D58]|uniref:hypothetical protein n=1 Tax=Leifsonia sp. A12D58 TaxID=3397674 RepID=UPI0039E15AFB